MMTANYQSFAGEVRRLDRAIGDLLPVAEPLGVASPNGQEWYELLRTKLLPQIDARPLLVVGIAGGTNIGKSAIFNHLAGEVASATSPLAAGTKHPVCLVPPDAAEAEVLARLFEPFELHAWQSPRDPLEDSPKDKLFWRVGSNLPPRLLLLDAPDVDSDVAVNWQRAKAIRRSADVLIAVLTQQKYNDAAVKQFFRAAVEADKPIVVIFNQCNLKADGTYWPEWLDTFCGSTGARPELVYVVPYDRRAVEQLRLPFYSIGADGRQAPAGEVNLRDDLASLHFDAIKIRTLRGALGRVLDERSGVGGYLQQIRTTAAEFSSAAEALSSTEMARVVWPTLPAAVLVDEICNWWDSGRSPWSKRIHGFYRVLGAGVTWPLRAAWDAVSRSTADPLEAFRLREREAVVLAVEKLIDELDRLAKVGNDTLRPRLEKMLSGSARADLLRRVNEAHGQLPAVGDDYRRFMQAESDAWKDANPRAVRFLQSLDHMAAVARPAVTVSLAVSGWVLAGDLVGQAAVQAASHTAGQLATEAAIAGGITGGGEAIVSTTSEGVRKAAGRLFFQLQSGYTRQRANWLAAWLERELMGTLLQDLRNGAEVPQGRTFQEVLAARQRIIEAQ